MIAEAPARARPPARIFRPQPGPQEAFLSTPADIAIYGGAAGGGKTWGLLIEPLRHIRTPGFEAVIFRRTYPQIRNEGGLWDEAYTIYPALKGDPRETTLKWLFPPFPGGASIRFAHMQHEPDRFNWQGAQIAYIGWDELTHFTAKQWWYMLSRNRSTCGVRPYIRATTNPDADSWVAELIAWWIDPETGYAIPERAGRVRWFVRVEEREMVWADTREELRARYPDLLPKSLTFIPARVYDNPALLERDPGYLANLQALDRVERERLLGGNWKIRATGGTVFDRAWFGIVAAVPAEGIVSRVRYWDKAATKTEDDPDADWSAGVRLAGHVSGLYFIEDVVRGQWSSHQREQVIRQVAALDPPGTQFWVEQEPGSGGKESAETTVRNLGGYDVRVERVTGDKVTRARPLAAQAEAGNVKLLAAPWNRAFLEELHGFPEGAHDDQVDAADGAFNKAALEGPLQIFAA